MAEYIEREAISEEIRKYYYKNPPNFSYGEGFDRGLDRAQRAILDAPASDVAPVRHGRWVDRIVDENEVIQPWMERYYCSECLEGGNQSWFKFCPTAARRWTEVTAIALWHEQEQMMDIGGIVTIFVVMGG